MGTVASVRHAALPTPVRTILWLVAYVLASLLGRIVTLDPGNVVVVWPASGVALVWLASAANHRQLAVDAVLLAATTSAVLRATGADLAYALVSSVAVGLALVPVLLVRRWIPEVWGAGGRRQPDRVAELGAFLGAIALGSLAVSLVRLPLDLVSGPIDLRAAVDRFTRHTASMSSIGLLGIFGAGWLAEWRDGAHPPVSRDRVLRLGVEVGALAVVTAAMLALFARRPDLPVTFVLTLTVVWSGLRMPRILAAAHGALLGIAVVVLTLRGIGPLARVSDLLDRVLVAQVFVTVVMVIGMTIALTRRQVVDTIERLERSEAEVSGRAALQDLLLAKLSDGVAIVDEHGRFVMTNEALRRIIAPTRSDLSPGTPVAPPVRLRHPDGTVVTDDEYPYRRALQGETVSAEVFLLRQGDGPQQVLELSALPLPDDPLLPRRAMVLVRDVTVATTHRESLVAFAGTVAHDLKNPLSVVDGWAEALAEDLAESTDPATAMALPMVRHIRTGVEQMRGLIADLLAHAVARDQALDLVEVDLRALVGEVVAARRLGPDDGEVVCTTGTRVRADQVLLRQVLDNLVGNGLKYVAPGHPARVVVDAEPAGPGWVRVVVRDNGIGIPADERERVFDRFARLRPAEYAGTGLGLAICKRIVERHGGTIEVLDNPDAVGTCFAFTLPLATEDHTGPGPW